MHLFYFFKCLFIFERERERERETERKWGRGREREGDTESEAGSRLPAVSTEPDAGSNPRTVRSWPEPKADASPMEPPRRPLSMCLDEIWEMCTSMELPSPQSRYRIFVPSPEVPLFPFAVHLLPWRPLARSDLLYTIVGWFSLF